MKRLLLFSLSVWCCLSVACASWYSRVIGTDIPVKVTDSSHPLLDQQGQYMTVVYLENLGFRKISRNSIENEVAWFLEQGYRVVELDYQHSEKAVSPYINMDIIAINDELNRGRFCGTGAFSKTRSYILMEGYRIARDVPYYKDDPSVYNWPGGYSEGDSLFMDIVYPVNSSKKVPVVLSFSYSNSCGKPGAQHQRLFLGYTLAMFDDSFLEGAPARGMAWAIADHPKYCDWGQGQPAGGPGKSFGSYETNPDTSRKVKSAIRTLRALGKELNLDGRIGLYGFSRASTAASLAVGNRDVPEFKDYGRFPGVSDRIQAAALGSGVFDYTIIYENQGDGDGSLETRCPLTWGKLEENVARWDSMGAVWTVKSKASAPVIFFYNTTDEKYYIHQIEHFKQVLESKHIAVDEVVDYSRGHAVPADTLSLRRVYDFMSGHLCRNRRQSKKP